MTFNYVTVSGSFAIPTGTVTFTPSAGVTDLTGTIPVIGSGATTYTVSGGSFTTSPMLATDNVGLLPPAWTWEVTIALTGTRAYSYPILVPFAGGSTATLSSLATSSAGGAIAAAAFTNPLTTLGDTLYEDATPAPARLAGNASATKKFLTQTGTGSASAAPAWGTIASTDLPLPPYGQRVAYSAVTSGFTAGTASSVLTSMTPFSGSQPSITLPGDGHTYRVSLSAAAIQPSSQQIAAVGIGTAGTAILKYTLVGYSGELDAPCYVQVDVAGTAQTISCFAFASSNGNITVAAAANAPAELSAVLVA